MEEQVSFTPKFSTSQEFTITLQGNTNEKPMCFDMPSNYTTEDVGVKSAVLKTSGNEKMHIDSWQTAQNYHHM
jgi:hypothetical protein